MITSPLLAIFLRAIALVHVWPRVARERPPASMQRDGHAQSERSWVESSQGAAQPGHFDQEQAMYKPALKLHRNSFLTWLLPLAFSACLAAAEVEPSIDFSYAGYGGGGVATPAVAAVMPVRPGGGDDTGLLQGAIDQVSALALTKNGFRGAVLLMPGRYSVEGRLAIRASGVVLRGRGEVTIVAAGKGRRTLIEIGSVEDPRPGPPVSVTDDVVPAGGRVMRLENTSGLRPGNRIVITRPSNAAWISALHMNGLPGNFADRRLDWPPGSRDLVWDRTITKVNSARQQITVAPVPFPS